ncbi:MAG TPA: serine/threonine-protein kinase, partial [Anaerolineales bacterium]|nr:serine/threonine-protein kinase [Anaerolineales bacterium]
MKIYTPDSLIANRYEVIQAPDPEAKVLMGGMGLIYICRDTKTDQPVALKTFQPKYLPNRAARDRFLREGTAWVDLGSHPHIVRCYEVKYDDPTAFLILELIAKEQELKDASLRSWMSAPMPVEQALLFAIQIARGMQHAAEKIPGFVHRDLKPENVLVGADKLPGTNINRLRVTDFGLVKIVTENAADLSDGDKDDLKIRRVQFTQGAGSPLYMAPEQWKKGKPVGAYTDVYALGCILYDMLTGWRAPSGIKMKELPAAHASGKLRPFPRNLPKPVYALLERSLVADAEKRYQDWKEVTTALEGAYAGLGVGRVPEQIGQEGKDTAERQSVASSYNEMGASYAHMGKAQVALGYFKKAMGIFRKLRDQHGEGASLRNLGNAYAALGNMTSALDYYEKSLTIARKVGDRRREANVLGNMGEVYRNLGDVQRAISYYEQYLAIAQEIGNRREEGNALGSLGLAYAALGEVESAVSYYEQYLAIAREIGDRRGEGNALGNLGNAYAARGDPQSALNHYNQYLVIAQEIGDRVGEGNATGNLGNVYLTLGEVRRAIDYYEKRLEIAREINDRRGESNTLGNLGIAYAQLGEAGRAIDYYEKRLKIAH